MPGRGAAEMAAAFAGKNKPEVLCEACGKCMAEMAAAFAGKNKRGAGGGGGNSGTIRQRAAGPIAGGMRASVREPGARIGLPESGSGGRAARARETAAAKGAP